MQARAAQDAEPQQQQSREGTPRDSDHAGVTAALRAENARLAERIRALEEEAGGKLPEEAAQKVAHAEAERDRLAAKLEAAGGAAEPDQAPDKLRAANEQLSERIRALEAELAATAQRAAAAEASGQPPASPKSPGKARSFLGRSLSRGSAKAPQQAQQGPDLDAAIKLLEAKNAAVSTRAAAAEEAREKLLAAFAALEAEKRQLAGAVASLEARLAAESAPKAEVLEKTRPPHAEGVKEQEGSEPDNRGAASMERGPMAGQFQKERR